MTTKYWCGHLQVIDQCGVAYIWILFFHSKFRWCGLYLGAFYSLEFTVHLTVFKPGKEKYIKWTIQQFYAENEKWRNSCCCYAFFYRSTESERGQRKKEGRTFVSFSSTCKSTEQRNINLAWTEKLCHLSEIRTNQIPFTLHATNSLLAHSHHSAGGCCVSFNSLNRAIVFLNKRFYCPKQFFSVSCNLWPYFVWQDQGNFFNIKLHLRIM